MADYRYYLLPFIRMMLITSATLGDQYLRYNRSLVPSSFYSVLDECEDIVWDHSTSDEAAFQDNIQDEYDVATFFNHSDEHFDSAAERLKLFFEAGRGLIARQSELSSCNHCECSWKELMGGK